MLATSGVRNVRGCWRNCMSNGSAIEAHSVMLLVLGEEADKEGDRERRGRRRNKPYTPLTPDRPPLAAITGKFIRFPRSQGQF